MSADRPSTAARETDNSPPATPAQDKPAPQPRHTLSDLEHNIAMLAGPPLQRHRNDTISSNDGQPEQQKRSGSAGDDGRQPGSDSGQAAAQGRRHDPTGDSSTRREQSEEPVGAAERTSVGGTRAGADAPKAVPNGPDLKDQEIARLKAENEQLRAEKASTPQQQRITALVAENAESKQQIAELKAENADGKQQLADLAARIDRLEQRPAASRLQADGSAQTHERAEANQGALDKQGAVDQGFGERKNDDEASNAKDAGQLRLKRAITLENMRAAGTLTSASGTMAAFATHETARCHSRPCGNRYFARRDGHRESTEVEERAA